MPTRVLHITSGDLWGGAEAQLFALVRELKKIDDLEIETLLFNDGLAAQRLRQGGVRVTVIDEAKQGTASLLRRIIAHLREIRPDIVHTHGYKECVLGSIAGMWTGVSCLRTVHGWIDTPARFWELKKVAVRLADLLTLRAQRRVVAVSGELGTRLAKYIRKEKVEVIENGIDAAPNPTPLRVAAPDTCWRVAIVGRLVPVKRVDLFLHVCRLLSDRYGSRVSFLVMGDGPLMPAMRSLVHDLGLQEQTALAGFVPDVVRQLQTVDVILITSEHEGLPITLLEAMAEHVPVVAHAVGGIPEVLAYGECGWLVDRQEPQRYYEAVCDVLENQAATRQKTAAAYARLTERYLAHQSAKRYADVYRRLIGAG